MLEEHDISIGCLTTYLGFILGFGLLVLFEFTDRLDVACWGVAALLCVCTYTIRRGLVTHDDRLHDAFAMGREYERTRNLSPIR